MSAAKSREWPPYRGAATLAAMRLFLAFCLVVSLPSISNAAQYACIGKVDQVTADKSGAVYASFSFQEGSMPWQVLCSLDGVSNGVSTATCKSILSVLVVARTTQQSVQLWFDNATGSSCSAPSWTSIANMGWYFGPALLP